MQVLSINKQVVNHLTGMMSGRQALRNATLQNSQLKRPDNSACFKMAMDLWKAL